MRADLPTGARWDVVVPTLAGVCSAQITAPSGGFTWNAWEMEQLLSDADPSGWLISSQIKSD